MLGGNITTGDCTLPTGKLLALGQVERIIEGVHPLRNALSLQINQALICIGDYRQAKCCRICGGEGGSAGHSRLLLSKGLNFTQIYASAQHFDLAIKAAQQAHPSIAIKIGFITRAEHPTAGRALWVGNKTGRGVTGVIDVPKPQAIACDSQLTCDALRQALEPPINYRDGIARKWLQREASVWGQCSMPLIKIGDAGLRAAVGIKEHCVSRKAFRQSFGTRLTNGYNDGPTFTTQRARIQQF
ncbi:hypothetical protein PFLU3_17920 [Pseudomonas fluorescens]|uniref:Uncharacterized protein n=1 Tax=Pseudomonas fluorescens TaxID=294 RepID=A0A0D0SKZ5_PSEFL|nr:hypothetical protein PFLU3_17920 [Pseudomonas fluorescens]